MTYVLMALAGLSVGGAFAMAQQKRPVWVPVLFGIAAAFFLGLALVSISRAS